MHATVGDRLVIRSHQVGAPDQTGEVIEVHGEGGAPPYLVRWDDGHESLFSPGIDAQVEHQAGQEQRRR